MEVDGGGTIFKFYDLKAKRKQEDSSWPFTTTSCSLSGLLEELQVARLSHRPTKSISTFGFVIQAQESFHFDTSICLAWYVGGIHI